MVLRRRGTAANLECVELHIGIPVCQPFDHGSNRLLCAVNSYHNQHPSSRNRASMIFPKCCSHTPILQRKPCRRHPVLQQYRVSFPVPDPSTATETGQSLQKTYQNVFPIFGGEVFVCCLGCKQAFSMSVIIFSVGMSEVS